MAFIDQNDILKVTNGGLDIILSYYPQAQQTISSARKEFKIREERTPSARLKQVSDGNWLVTDFGGDQIPRNGIQICQREEDITYKEALALLAGRYKIGGLKQELHKADFEKRPAKPDEKEGEYYFETNDDISEAELNVLGPKVTSKVCLEYGVFSLKSFTHVKNREAFVTSSNENYPIFLIDRGEFKKIYQPKNTEKQYRFRYVGKKPKDYLNGFDQLVKAHHDYEYDMLDNPDNKKSAYKYPEAILCSGDSDALNIAGMGYKPLWLNSETADLPGKLFKEIMSHVDNLFYLPDIDDTGVKAAIKLGMKYLSIKIVWLPLKLKQYRDMRGNPRKDFKDYIEIWDRNAEFKKLVECAKPMQFWDEKFSKNGIEYVFNNEHTYHFLSSNGFYQVENKNTKEGYELIRINGNIVEPIKPKHAKGFIQKFMQERYMPIPLRNMIYKTNQLNDSSLENLPHREIDFTDYDKTTQYLFFSNKTWEVTAAGIKEYKPGSIKKYVWQEEVIDHKVKCLKPPFKIKYNKDENEYDIEIIDDSSLFIRFLINTSRIHWQKELEERILQLKPDQREKYLNDNKFKIDGPLLNENEIYEQKQHLINKIFALGYLLHRYKNPARPWCVFAMDNRISDTGTSFGRSGKSIAFKAIRYFMKSISLDGRNPKLTDNQFIYDRVTEHTDYILIDDANQYLNFDFFFAPLTGSLVVNPKNNQSYEIPFENVPKFCITSNFTLRNLDASTEGRLLYTVFSDYYHIRTDDTNYKEDRSVNQDFGKNLFMDYNENEWNLDFNFFAYCISFFLSVPSPMKINPPMDNVTKRNLKTVMGDIFENWASVYFSKENGTTDKHITKHDALKDFIESTQQHKWTTHKFTKALKAFCRYNNYILNPESLLNSDGRIIRKIDGKATEMVYVQTIEEINHEDTEQLNQLDYGAPMPEDDKPF